MDQLKPYVFILLLAMIAFGIVVKLIGNARAKLRIVLPQGDYKSGDTLRGHVEGMALLKALKVKALSVELRCRDYQGKRIRTLYSREQTVAENIYLQPLVPFRYNFSFDIPHYDDFIPAAQNAIERLADQFHSQYDWWELRARIDMEGVDRETYKKVKIKAHLRIQP